MTSAGIFTQPKSISKPFGEHVGSGVAQVPAAVHVAAASPLYPGSHWTKADPPKVVGPVN